MSTITPLSTRPAPPPMPNVARDQADGGRDALARELVADDPEGEREDGAGDALDRAGGDEHLDRVRQRAHERADRRTRRARARSTRSLPNMSPSRPTIGVAIEAVSRKAVSTQVTSVAEVPRSFWIAGSAGATIVCVSAKASARQRRGRRASGCSAGARGTGVTASSIRVARRRRSTAASRRSCAVREAAMRLRAVSISARLRSSALSPAGVSEIRTQRRSWSAGERSTTPARSSASSMRVAVGCAIPPATASCPTVQGLAVAERVEQLELRDRQALGVRLVGASPGTPQRAEELIQRGGELRRPSWGQQLQAQPTI